MATIKPIIAMVVMAIADKAEIMWFGLAKERRWPFVKKMSSIASIKILKILLPNRFPIARSIAPIFTAEIETITSGRFYLQPQIDSPGVSLRVSRYALAFSNASLTAPLP